MARPSSKHPTELELEILKVLWRDGPSRGRGVRATLTRKLAYTSVMTIMNIMVRKGYLSRRKEGAGYVYQPRVQKQTTTRRMLRDLMDRAFDGSATAVMINLLEEADLDEKELRELKGLLEQKSGENQT